MPQIELNETDCKWVTSKSIEFLGNGLVDDPDYYKRCLNGRNMVAIFPHIDCQVCQWLLAIGMEQHVSKFAELQVNGGALMLLTSADFKILGITSDDKGRLKRKIKELKVQAEKERKQIERDRKGKEKLQRKAEKANKKK